MRPWLLLGATLAFSNPTFGQAIQDGPITGRYAAYVGGLNVLNLDASFDLNEPDYRVEITFETAGVLATFLNGRQVSRVEGGVEPGPAGRLLPATYRSDGLWRGRTRLTEIDYRADPPRIELDPPNTSERELVPAELQAGTVDALTALAALLRRVAATGRCEGEARLFDGRRVTDMTARTEGSETLAPHRYGSYSGTALRCGFEGRQVAGFWTGRDRTEQASPRSGTVWFASPAPGAPLMPVRIEADTGSFGRGIIHLTAVGQGQATPISVR